MSLPCDVLESDHKITIHVEILLDDAVVRIEIQFGEIVGDHVAAELWLLTPGNKFSLRCIFYGIDIQHFADSFGRLSKKRTDTARLTDWDGEIQSFFVVDLRRGYIAVGGKFDVATYGIEVWSEDRFLQTSVFD